VSKPTITVIPDALLERMAKAGYEEVVKRTEHLRDPDGRTWETETEALREDWRAIARAIQQSSGAGLSTASRSAAGARRVVMFFVGCAVALVLLGGSGVAFWAAGWRSLPSPSELLRPAPAMSEAELVEPGARRPASEATAASGTGPEATAPPLEVPAEEPKVPSLPSQSAAGDSGPAAPAAEAPEPQKPTCVADLDPWPADSTSQAKAIQILLRDLGFYSGTTRGTVGPATRAAIRQFQAASDEAETGEPSRMLFDSLQKKKCASAAPDASSAITPPAKD